MKITSKISYWNQTNLKLNAETKDWKDETGQKRKNQIITL